MQPHPKPIENDFLRQRHGSPKEPAKQIERDDEMLLVFENVVKSYENRARPVLNGVSLELNRGQTLALTGDSGSGKSTLLHLAAALDQPDQGRVLVDGAALSDLGDQDASQLRRNTVALVFQQFNLIPSLTVGQNLQLHARLSKRLDADWADHLAARLGLSDLLTRYPEELSGGQQQRVAIARALAVRPPLLLADEPTGNLDDTASAEVMSLMLSLVKEAGSGLLLVTHSKAIAAQLSAQIHLKDGVLA